MFVLGERRVAGRLQVQPKSRIDVKKSAKTKAVSADTSPPLANDVAGDSVERRWPAPALSPKGREA